MKSKTISVRKQTLADIPLIVDYFLNADKEHLLKMGVDASKLYKKDYWLNLLEENYKFEDKNKNIFYIIWLIDDNAVGHCNINKIKPHEEAYMHLHLWKNDERQKGLGLEFLKLTIPIFFQIFGLKKLYCEPYSLNPAPNKILEKFGFELLKTYETTPGAFNFQQQVNQWCLTKEKYNII